MDKSDPPESFGVFKPVGHTVIAFRSQDDLAGAIGALLGLGFANPALVCYTPQQMVAQADDELQAPSALAAFGQELNLVRAQRALALDGCSFLVVLAEDDRLAGQVATVARSMNAVAAQRYGHFLIEELIDRPAGTPQRFESPERGLDLPVEPAPGR